jgi:hypothetical protein
MNSLRHLPEYGSPESSYWLMKGTRKPGRLAIKVSRLYVQAINEENQLSIMSEQLSVILFLYLLWFF